MSVSDDLFDQGERIRRQVLGDEHVDRSLANASEFGRPLHLAMLTALDRQTELAVHIKGALNNGCTVDEIRETLLHTAVYCGVPAAIEAFRTAESVLGPAAANGHAPARADGASADGVGADADGAGDTAVEA
jgi:4-carboxymuconolactone decarboxylase